MWNCFLQKCKNSIPLKLCGIAFTKMLRLDSMENSIREKLWNCGMELLLRKCKISISLKLRGIVFTKINQDQIQWKFHLRKIVWNCLYKNVKIRFR